MLRITAIVVSLLALPPLIVIVSIMASGDGSTGAAWHLFRDSTHVSGSDTRRADVLSADAARAFESVIRHCVPGSTPRRGVECGSDDRCRVGVHRLR
jgi:hypothetical protein